uniref:Uncharacterized protein n=1 Tax=Anguilla anguilla TaxID=7936 RepID=A0A0E9TIC0_ANGAN
MNLHTKQDRMGSDLDDNNWRIFITYTTGRRR